LVEEHQIMGARAGLEQILERLADHALPPRARHSFENIKVFQIVVDRQTAHGRQRPGKLRFDSQLLYKT
jgi:hypothetical protein